MLLMRSDLRQLWQAAKNNGDITIHPGLLLQQGWEQFETTTAENEGVGGKTEHLNQICKTKVTPFYQSAFKRWERVTAQAERFSQLVMKIQGRLFIGLSGSGPLETGCAIHQTYGMPYLPGSSVKGIARAYAERVIPDQQEIIHEMFGAGPEEADESGYCGLVTFHDAWWKPPAGGEGKPFVLEIVTSHHSDYYGSEGEKKASDLDSPIPNALIGVVGSFLFTLEGPQAWVEQAHLLLKNALLSQGIGAKTSAGYGYFEEDSAWACEYKERMRKIKEGEQEESKLLALGNFLGQSVQLEEWLKASILQLLREPEANGKSEEMFLLGRLEKGEWGKKQDQVLVATCIKALLKRKNKWCEVSKKKNPDRDKVYVNTKRVLKYL
ncbi:MAG: type III-B CRISPR module RAMP protein Cmr6 [Gammaproteobacteria bacterium]